MRKEVFPMNNQKKTGKWIRYATAFVLLLCFCLIQPVFGTIADAIEGAKDLEAELLKEIMEQHEHDEEEEHHHHHDHDHDHEHHHDHDHEHHHEHDENCTCGCHDHDHHHHHHADEVFTSFGMETAATYTKEDIEEILKALDDEETYGIVLRAKGMVADKEGGWIYFDYVPEESNVRAGKPDVTGKFCVIGSKLKEDALKKLFER